MSMIRKYHNHKLQTNLGHRKEEPHTNLRQQGDKQSKACTQPAPSDCKTSIGHKVTHHKHRTILQNPTMGATINNKSTTTEPPP